MLDLMVLPILMGVVLTGILAYLGIHIVHREVIFVDLALAQIAALGAALSVLLGLAPHGLQAYGASFLFVLLGAALFASTKMKIQEMLLGNILFASSWDVTLVLGVSAAVGAFHLVLRKRFLLISVRPEEAARQGLSLVLWDFLFYASLGLVVVSAVGVVGILLVFSYLIIPAVCAMLLRPGLGARIAGAWIVGAIGTFLGVYLSVALDLPTGATTVYTFAAVLVAVALLRGVWRPARTRPANCVSPRGPDAAAPTAASPGSKTRS